MRVLINTNVLLDRILTREPYSQSAGEILDLCAKKVIEGFIAVNSLLDIFYITRRDISERNRRKLLLSLREVLSVVGVEDLKIEEALRYSAFSDLEDCIQYLCAKEIKADYIITRNVKDFSRSDITVITPDEFLELLG